MKGIIIASQTGLQPFPLKRPGSGIVVPSYDKPMIYYPLGVLLLAGITEVMVVAPPPAPAAVPATAG